MNWLSFPSLAAAAISNTEPDLQYQTPTPRWPLMYMYKTNHAGMGIQQKEEQSEIYISVTCLVVSGRRMPPALFLGCSSFSTSTRFSEGIRRFAMAARRVLRWILLGEQVDAGLRWLYCSRGSQGLGFIWRAAEGRMGKPSPGRDRAERTERPRSSPGLVRTHTLG